MAMLIDDELRFRERGALTDSSAIIYKGGGA
jgi:hypothetical protein